MNWLGSLCPVQIDMVSCLGLADKRRDKQMIIKLYHLRPFYLYINGELDIHRVAALQINLNKIRNLWTKKNEEQRRRLSKPRCPAMMW